jgi:outer membrane protein assembly factor BamA
MRSVRAVTLVTLVVLAAGPTTVAAQEPQPATRAAVIEQAQAEKVKTLHPYVLGEGERVMDRVEDLLTNGLRWRPFLESAYEGGGLPLGVGYMRHVSPYDLIDVRGSYTPSGYTRAEVEFTAPHLFRRRGVLSLLGGWRKATEVGFYGLGPDSSKDARTSYEFERPYAAATLTLRPTRRHWTLGGRLEWTRWSQRSGEGTFPSVDTVFSPQTLPGLGADVTYIHTQGTLGFDWRPAPGYARRGGYYGVTVHDYADTHGTLGFDRVEYEAVQHVPILREAWVVSLRGHAETAYPKGNQQIPFFMLPSLGGGSTLRGYSSWRFRDRNSLLLQAEWRIMVNRFFDTALFYDTGKVAARASDLDLRGLRHDVGVGFRFHSLDATPLRIELAKSHEGLRVVFAASHAF